MRKKSIDENQVVTRGILRGEVRQAIEESEERMKEQFRFYRDEILTKLDQVMGELAQMREDKVFFDHDVETLKETSTDHEKRIISLEERQIH